MPGSRFSDFALTVSPNNLGRHLMKTLLFASLTLAALALPATAQDRHKPMYVTPAEAAKLTAKVVGGVSTHFLAPASGHLTARDAYGQELVYRTASGVPEVHANWADHFVVTEGEATLVVGGTVVGEHETGPGEKRGTSITGGTSYALTPGTSITVPPGVPHWTVLKPGAHFRAVVFKLKD
jgi:mannose-6-phosphate isomerase-like protein (cupin superfamily)